MHVRASDVAGLANRADLIAGVDEDEFTDLDAGAMGAMLEGWGRSIKNAET